MIDGRLTLLEGAAHLHELFEAIFAEYPSASRPYAGYPHEEECCRIIIRRIRDSLECKGATTGRPSRTGWRRNCAVIPGGRSAPAAAAPAFRQSWFSRGSAGTRAALSLSEEHARAVPADHPDAVGREQYGFPPRASADVM